MSELKCQRTNQFCKDVENRVKEKSISYIEAVLEICEIWDIKPEVSRGLIDNNIKNMMKAEFTNRNMIKPPNQLPL